MLRGQVSISARMSHRLLLRSPNPGSPNPSHMIGAFRSQSAKPIFEKPELELKLQKLTKSKLEIQKGREHRSQMAPEYISPQLQNSKSLWKRLVRQDCLRRRRVTDLPEFYPGSVLAVTYADRHAPEKKMRFVGRVLIVEGFGTNHKFLLRNVVDGVPVNIKFDLYHPGIEEVRLIRLEKWLDTNLRYLMDCDPFYCTIPFDTMPEVPPPATVPIKLFTAKVPQRPPMVPLKLPTTDEEYNNWDKMSMGKTQKFFERQRFGRKYRKKSRFTQEMWPGPKNFFFDEDDIKEDEINIYTEETVGTSLI